MNFTSGVIIKNFNKQYNLSCEVIFDRDISRQSAFLFGVSGQDTNFCKIQNGRIYDNNNNFIYSVNYDSTTSIRTEISSGLSVVYVNNNLLSKSIVTGYFDNLLISGNGDTYINAKINGEIPELTFNKLNDFSGLNNLISGSIINNTPSRTYTITGGVISSNSDRVSISGYTSGEISGMGYIWLMADTGFSYPTDNIGLILSTNFGDVAFSISSNSSDPISFSEYLNFIPEDSFISVVQDKPFQLTSYFSSGATRNINITLDEISGAYYLPTVVNYEFSGSGYMTGLLSGSGTLTGNLTGVYTGTNETGISGYSIVYDFTGLASVFTSGILSTGILESSGKPDFIDIWNLKTGTNSFIYDDYKYWEYYSGTHYENTGKYIPSYAASINNFYIGVYHNGQGLSGFNVSKLSVSDGILSGEYLLSGEGEYYS